MPVWSATINGSVLASVIRDIPEMSNKTRNEFEKIHHYTAFSQKILFGLIISLYIIMPSRRSIRKTKKQFHNIEAAVSRSEGNQSLARFGRVGQDKFSEEETQRIWLKNIGAKKDLQKYINRHYYKYDSKKLKLHSAIRQPITFLYPTKTRRRRQ